MKKLNLFLVLFSQLNIHGLSAQTTVINPADKIITPIAKSYMKGSFQFLSVGIIENEKQYLYNFDNRGGTAAIINEAPVYEIGSVSKAFSSVILANAFLENRAKPDDDIRKYLEGNYPNLQFNGKAIALIHLVNLTSRLPNNMPEPPASFKQLSEDSASYAFVHLHEGYTKKKLLDDLHYVTLDTVPGLLPRHSNTAALLLTFILENIYHQPYPYLLKKYITDPLKMNTTFNTTAPGKIKLMAKGYSDNGVLMPYLPANETAAFGLKSNIHDMTRFMQFQLNEKDAAVKLNHQAAWGDTGSFALGMNWFLARSPYGKRIVKNDGTTFGFTTYMLMYPELKFGVVLMTNKYSFTSNDDLGKIAQEIFEQSFYTPEQRSSDGFGFSPNINLFLSNLDKKGFAHATDAFTDLKKNNPSFDLTENEINNWAYSLMQKNKLARALEIFKLNVNLHPASWNVYDSYGEALLKNGQKEDARKMYQKSVELNPGNESGKKALENISRQ